MRDLIILSHANPEDNQFTEWLALRLISEGYPVWTDRINLIGGEDTWKTIEKIIRERAAKFLYVLSRTSNQKDGVLQELSVAKAVARNEGLENFIIPLHIDDLPYNEINIEINRQNSIPFEYGWARGLKQLLEALERDQISKQSDHTPSLAASWWRNQYSAEKGVIDHPEEYLSNWFPLVTSLPPKLYYHLLYEVRETGVGDVAPTFPFIRHGIGLLSFASRDDFKDVVIERKRVADTHSYNIEQLLTDKFAKTFLDYKKTREIIVNLLGQALHKKAEQRQLVTHEMANKTECFYFTKGQVEKDKLKYVDTDGNPKSPRAIIGYKTIRSSDGNSRKRIWHFGISAKVIVYPVFILAIKPHVLFSDDGEQIWQDDNRLHKARMNQCKDWWNDDWRDRILATVQWLADEDGKLSIPVSSEFAINFSQLPLIFDSPVSYLDPKSGQVNTPIAESDEEQGEAVESTSTDDDEVLEEIEEDNDD